MDLYSWLEPQSLTDPVQPLAGEDNPLNRELASLNSQFAPTIAPLFLNDNTLDPIALNNGALGRLTLASRKPTLASGSSGDDIDAVKGNTKYKALAGDDQITIRKTGNIVLGGGGNDRIDAQKGKGNNVLKGGGGEDELIGGGREDLLVGGGGADLLVIADGKLNKGMSIIKGFKNNDAIAIRNVKKADEFDDLIFNKEGKNTLIRVGKRDIALVQSIKPKALKKRDDDFVFGSPSPGNNGDGGDPGGDSGGDVGGDNAGGTVPILSIGDRSIPEGNNGTTNATFTVSLDQVSTDTVTVDYSLTPNTATAGNDYTNRSGTLTFAPGTTTQTITVPIVGDTVDEPNETFTVQLTNPNQGQIGDGQALGIIVDDDEAIALSISDIDVVEGNTNGLATFTVTLSTASPTPVTVDYSTAAGTATATSDYTAVNGTLNFAPGITNQTITVPIIGDDVEEGDETVLVNLSNPVGAVLTTSQATGTLLNDDIAPEFRDKRRGKKLEKPSAQPDLDFLIFDTLSTGQVIEDSDDRADVGVFENAIEVFDFSTVGFLGDINSSLDFAIGTLTATRSGDDIIYLFSSDEVEVFVDNPGESILINNLTLAIDAMTLTVDVTDTDLPDDFDPVRAVNDLDYIIQSSVMSYAIDGSAYGGIGVDDVSFFPNLCPDDEFSDANCEDLEIDIT